MKPSQLTTALRLSITLLLLSSTATAIAYDFESGGIYYNITSANTVEVTYRDTNYASYSGKVEIPSTVSHNNKPYTVTAIGEKAFYVSPIADWRKSSYKSYSNTQSESCITIPETVNSIGDSAFFNIEISIVNCLSPTPPNTIGNGCFYIHEFGGNGYTVLSGYYGNNELDFSYYDNDTGLWYWRDNRAWTLLCVLPDSYNIYKSNNKWRKYFNFIAPIGAEETERPIIGVNEYNTMYTIIPAQNNSNCRLFQKTIYGRHYSNGIYSVSTWQESNSGSIYWPNNWEDEFGYTPSYVVLSVSSFAYEEGKLPSAIVGEDISISPMDFMGQEVWEEDEVLYDFCIDGICYNFIGENSVAVAPDAFIHFVKGNIHFRCYDAENVIIDDCQYGRLGLYNYQLVIPETVVYNDRTYDVIAISDNTMGYFERYYDCNLYSFDDMGIIYVYPYEYPIWINSCLPKTLTLPITINSIGDNAFPNYSLGNSCFLELTLIISGNGQWSSYNLNLEVPRLDIASGITAIPGLKVNPREVYCYAKVPPTCDENTFTDYTGTLHVPESSLAAYFTAPYWCNFLNIVGDAVELQGISLNRDTADLQVGEELRLNASLQPANASVDSTQWESSNTAIATVVDGVVTAKAQGECDITVTCLDKRATCHVTVNDVRPTAITLSQENAMMELGGTLTLTATVEPDSAIYQTINWASSNTSVASVSSEGVVTASGVGECDIVASCRGLSDTCHVKVVEQFIYVTLDKHNASLLPNHILTLTPSVTPAPTPLVVTSSNPDVAAARLVNGVVQVVGISVGTSVIKVNSADGNAFADSCLVNVYTEVGDVDGDGFVKIDDVTTLIDHLLSGNTLSVVMANADVDFSGAVNIADVTALIDHLLSGTSWINERFMVNGVAFTMIRVPAGTFMMGATPEQGDDVNNWEKPVHQVTLSSSFLIGQTEVTQELWQAVMGSNPSKHTGNLLKPVENVTWNDCQEFITRLKALTGQNFRLPTEAEWEYAARGANKSRGYKYAGSDNIDEVGWVTGTTTHPVGSLAPNELNLYDMSGNVDEWIQDYWYTYTSEPQTDPMGGEPSNNHVYRGGSWYSGAPYSRVSYRFFRTSTFQRGTMGLRLAL